MLCRSRSREADAHLTSSFSLFCDENEEVRSDMLLGCARKRFKHYSDSEKNNLTQDEGAFHLLTCCCDFLQTEERMAAAQIAGF